MVKYISITKGIPTVGFSLILVIFLSMLKDFFEDFKRWMSDNNENNCLCNIY